MLNVSRYQKSCYLLKPRYCFGRNTQLPAWRSCKNYSAPSSPAKGPPVPIWHHSQSASLERSAATRSRWPRSRSESAKWIVSSSIKTSSRCVTLMIQWKSFEHTSRGDRSLERFGEKPNVPGNHHRSVIRVVSLRNYTETSNERVTNRWKKGDKCSVMTLFVKGTQTIWGNSKAST